MKGGVRVHDRLVGSRSKYRHGLTVTYVQPRALHTLHAHRALVRRNKRKGNNAKKVAREEEQKRMQPDAGLEPATSRLRACHSTD